MKLLYSFYSHSFYSKWTPKVLILLFLSQTSHLCQHHVAALVQRLTQSSHWSLQPGRCSSQRDCMAYIYCSEWLLKHCRMRAKHEVCWWWGRRASNCPLHCYHQYTHIVGSNGEKLKGKITLIWTGPQRCHTEGKRFNPNALVEQTENKHKQLPCQPVSNDFYTQYKLSHGGKGSWNKVFIHVWLQL